MFLEKQIQYGKSYMPENYSMAAIYHNCPALGQINGWDWPQSSIWPITSTPRLPKSNALAI
jgi:hypothetical protein